MRDNNAKLKVLQECDKVAHTLQSAIEVLYDNTTEIGSPDVDIDEYMLDMIQDTHNRIFATIEQINDLIALKKMDKHLIEQRKQKKEQIENLTGVKE